jgi:hypothetical protein
MQVQHQRSQLGLRLNILKIFSAKNYSSRDDRERCAGIRQPPKLSGASPSPYSKIIHALTRGSSEFSVGKGGREDGRGGESRAAPSDQPGGPV